MASLKEMRNRIGSVKSTQKITKALNMVAAAKLKRAQDQAESARPYARKMAAVIANLAAGVSGDGAPKLLAGTGTDQKHLIVVATGDKGLAGGFNTNVIRAARERINTLIAAGKDVRIIAVGRKVPRRPVAASTATSWSSTFEMSRPQGHRPAGGRADRGPDRRGVRGRQRRRRDPVLQPLPVGHLPGPDAETADPGRRRRRRPADQPERRDL